MEVIGVISIAVIIWYGGYLVINGTMTPGAFFSFMAAMLLAYTPVRKLSGANNLIQQALAAAERVFDVLDMKTEQAQTRAWFRWPGSTVPLNSRVSRCDTRARRFPR